MAKIVDEFLKEPRIAYFSMEIGIQSNIPTYSGGLGVLAGDTIKSAADLKLPMVAVTLLTKKGYFRQDIDAYGRQHELPDDFNPSDFMTQLPERVSISIEGRDVFICGWLYIVRSETGGSVPIIFLDTDLSENTEQDRQITQYLYGGDNAYRFKQEMVLGIGGTRLLYEIGFLIKKFHMNEGHSSLLTVELLRMYKKDIEEVWDERLVWNAEKVRSLCVFTTHTPVSAGHDKFSYDLVKNIFTEPVPLSVLQEYSGSEQLNMTKLALNLSNYVNGVAKKHGEVSKSMFPGYEIHAITNGVHSYTWTSEPFKQLFNKYFPGWANEPAMLVRVERIPADEIWEAHQKAKRNLIDYINRETNVELNYDTFTIGFARRATAYKRADLLFQDIKRLCKIGEGRIQIVYGGKAHPKDEQGKQLIQKIHEIKEKIKDKIKIVYVKNYNMDIALKIVSGVDIWLNTPLRPLEASGTSGMKASHNGVPNFSVLDGWWLEGHIEGCTGWSIGPVDISADPNKDAEDLYYKLEKIILPLYYKDRENWIKVMQNAISKNAYFFNSHRMMRRYVTEAYIR
ncbi:MAG: alpha-glucan family phosphorylase [Thermodesulfovibrionales bacterium]|nr:alpha-glucan family phosphorylase [Thermodesulfovibrionales bacterium]